MWSIDGWCKGMIACCRLDFYLFFCCFSFPLAFVLPANEFVSKEGRFAQISNIFYSSEPIGRDLCAFRPIQAATVRRTRRFTPRSISIEKTSRRGEITHGHLENVWDVDGHFSWYLHDCKSYLKILFILVWLLLGHLTTWQDFFAGGTRGGERSHRGTLERKMAGL